jgi:hypothetical protein
MNTGEFKSSINQMESELTSSRKKLHDKFEKLKSDFKELQDCIARKDEQIAALKSQRNDLIGLLDQAFAIIDDPSQAKLLDDLDKVESDVEALIGMAKTGEPSSAGGGAANGANGAGANGAEGAGAAKPSKDGDGKPEPGDQAKKWARDVLKGVGGTPRAAPAAGPGE